MSDKESKAELPVREMAPGPARAFKLGVMTFTIVVVWVASLLVLAKVFGMGPVYEREILLALIGIGLALVVSKLAWWLTTRHFRGFVIGGVITLLLLAGSLAIMAELGHRGWDREMAAWASIGGPTDLAQLRREVPPEANAAMTYRHAISLLPEYTNVEIMASERPDEADVYQLQQIARRFSKGLPIVHEATTYPDCDWKGAMPLDKMHRISSLLACQAIVRAERGDAEGAIQSIEAGLTVGDHIKADGLLYSKLRQISVLREHLNAYQVSGRHCVLDGRALMTRMAASNHLTELRRAMLTEVPLGMASLQKHDLARRFESNWLGRGLMRFDLCYYLRDMRQAADDLEAFGVVERPRKRPPSWIYFTHLMDTSYDRLRKSAMFASIDLRMADVATRLREFKRSSGAYPALLSELGGPTDCPVSGKPIRYRRLGNGFHLESPKILSGDRVWTWQWPH